jgi:hypothetical protein
MFDGLPLKKLIRARGTRQPLVHGASPVARILALREHDDRGCRLPVYAREPDSAAFAETVRDDPVPPEWLLPKTTPVGSETELAALARPALDGLVVELVERWNQPTRAVGLDDHG